VKRHALALLMGVMPLVGQDLAIDRGWTAGAAKERVERVKGFAGDFFRIGASGEVWMIETMRLWAMPGCSGPPGDSIEKITLLGALDNPPVPGQPVCDCHALVALATATFAKGSSTPSNPDVRVTKKNGVWQLDFNQVRWSLPGGSDALFTVRVTRRAGSACRSDREWGLAAAPAAADYRLHLMNEKGVPIGLEEAGPKPRSILIQVWARRTN
jgi:hypothetical protein